MKKIVLMGILFLFLITSCCRVTVAEKSASGMVDLWLILYLQDYQTNYPIANISVSASVILDISARPLRINPSAQTNEMGEIRVFVGSFAQESLPTGARLVQLSLSDNYLLIKVNDVFLEEIKYDAEYSGNSVRYTNLRINLNRKDYGTYTLISAYIWICKGRLVAISDFDPVSGRKLNLMIKPAIKVESTGVNKSVYESYYFVPLKYSLLISQADQNVKPRYSPLRIVVDENTTFINWAYYAAKEYLGNTILTLNQEIDWLNSVGLSLSLEAKESEAIKRLLERSLDLYSKREYEAALSGIKNAMKLLDGLENWISNMRVVAFLTTVGVSYFAYGLSSLLSNFIFEEQKSRVFRLISKISLFFLLMIGLSIINPSLKIGYALMLEKILRVTIKVMMFPLLLAGTIILSILTYFSIMIISIKRVPITDLAINLGIRSLKRRTFRTLLTLITIALVTSSSIVFLNISVTRETRVKSSWSGTKISGILINLKDVKAQISEYDIKWIKAQEWCENVAYIKEVSSSEYYGDPNLGDYMISRIGILRIGSQNNVVNIILVDPLFFDKYYNISRYVRGAEAWREFRDGGKVAILPTNYDVGVGEQITLGVDETIVLSMNRGAFSLGVRGIGLFRVIGKFDPSELLDFKKIDGSPLFQDPSRVVLIPVNSVEDESIITSEIIIIPKSNYDPFDIARELTYMFGVPVIANKNGLASLVVWSIEVSAIGFIPLMVPMVIAGLIIYTSMLSVYEERKREISTLAILGLDPDNTFKVFIAEALLLGLIGTFIGFFGSYLLIPIISNLVSLLGGKTALQISHNWSIFAILNALFIGVVMVFLGGYIPATKVRKLSQMGRLKTRDLTGELIYGANDTFIFSLPLRETIQNSELLFNYVKENLARAEAFIDHRSVKGEIRGDGSFEVSYMVRGPSYDVLIPCKLIGEREGDIVKLLIEFPRAYRDYGNMIRILRDLETKMIGYPSWRDMQLKMRIVREAPKRQKSLDEVIDEIREVMRQIEDTGKKLKILEAQRGRLSEEIYEEFRRKYLNLLDEKIKVFRSMAIGLEPYSNQIQEEIKKINVEIERITIAYNLGEISEEEYVKTCSPLQNRLTALRSRLEELNEILEFLKKPSGIGLI